MKLNAFVLPTLLILSAGIARAQEKAAAPAPSPSPSEGPSFPAQVEQVVVDVVVTEKKQGPVLGLTKDDFTVTEDGVPQTISTFESIQVAPAPSATPAPRPRVSVNTDHDSQTGRSFLLVFDDIHLTPFRANRAKVAVAEFLKSGTREGDRVSLIATSGSAWWSTRMEAGRDELIAMLKHLDGRHIPDISNDRVSDYEAMRIHVYRDPQVQERVLRRFETYGVTPNGDRNDARNMGDDPRVTSRASETYFAATARNRITLEVLERALLGLASSRGRKSLILVSEGFIYDPNLDEFKKVVQASRRANCAIYFLDTEGLGGLPAYMTAQFGPSLDTRDLGAAFSENLERAEGAESIAADSGGFSVKNTNDLAKGIQRIADDSRAYYLIGYNPTNAARDGKFRKIQVKVERKGAEVRARKGYYAPLDGKVAARKPGASDPEIQAAMDSPYELDQIPLRMTSYVFEETLLGKATVVLAAEVDIRGFQFEEKDGRFIDSLEFLAVAAHRESGEFFKYDQKVDMKLLAATREKIGKTWYPVIRDFELPPGGYQAKVVVRDKNSGKIGTVIHEFAVPDLSTFRTSSPILSDTLQPTPEGEKTSVPRPTILARRTFAPGADLYTTFDVFGAEKDKATGMPKVTAGFVIRRKNDGTVLNIASPTFIKPTSLGKLSRLMRTPLGPAAPGEYELVLNLRDEVAGKALEVKEPFSVE